MVGQRHQKSKGFSGSGASGKPPLGRKHGSGVILTKALSIRPAIPKEKAAAGGWCPVDSGSSNGSEAAGQQSPQPGPGRRGLAGSVGCSHLLPTFCASLPLVPIAQGPGGLKDSALGVLD